MLSLLWLAFAPCALAVQSSRNSPHSLVAAEDVEKDFADRADFIAEGIELWRQSLENVETQAVNRHASMLDRLQESCHLGHCLTHGNCKHVKDGMRQTLACVGAAIGLRRSHGCRCSAGDGEACSSAARVPSVLGLEDYLSRNSAVAAALEAADSDMPCADHDDASSMSGTRWLEGATEMPLTIAASSWIDSWMDNQLFHINASDVEVKDFRPEEVSLLASRIVDRLDEAGALAAWQTRSSEALASALLQEVVLAHAQQAVTPSCAEAFQACGKTASCQQLATSMWALPPAEALQQLAAACHEEMALSAAMHVAANCQSPLPAKDMAALSAAIQAIPSAQLCQQLPHLVQKHANQFMPSALSKASEDIDLEANGCSAARTQCGQDVRCKAAIEAMEQQHPSAKGMLQEALKLCDVKGSLLMAFHVSAECPGLLPQNEAQKCRDAVFNEEPEVLCSKMKQLTFVLGELLDMEKPPSKKAFLAQARLDASHIETSQTVGTRHSEPRDRCEQARVQCNSTNACAQRVSSFGRGSVEALAASLQLCSDGTPAMLAALDMEAECSPSPKAAAAIASTLRKQPSTDASACKVAWRALANLQGADFYGASPESEQCAVAQMKCASDSRCSQAAMSLSSQSLIAGSSSAIHGGDAVTAAAGIFELCEHKEVMVMAIDVASSCSGPLQAVEMEALKDAANALQAEDVCMQIADASNALIQRVRDWNSTEVLRQSKARVAKVVLPTLAEQASEQLASLLDVAPTDNRLNQLELAALERLDIVPIGMAWKSIGPLDATVGLTEVAAMLQPRLQPQLEKLVEEL